MRAIRTLLPVLILVAVLSSVIGGFFAAPAIAADMTISSGAEAARGNDQVVDLMGEQGVFRTITNLLLFIIGAISVIMIIIGGLRYVVSGGDASAVSAAKNTILYAVIGLIVAILAYAAVDFVIGSFTGNAGSGPVDV